MPAIQTAEDAVRVAETFIGKYHPFRVLNKAMRENGAWLIEFDVGVLETKIVRMKLDADTGLVTEYTKVGSK